MSMTDQAAFVAEHSIKTVIARAARCVDSRDFEGLASLFTEGGVLQRPGASPLTGRAAIADSYTSRPGGRITRHLVTNIVVTLQSPSTATAESYVLLWSGDESQEDTAFGRKAHGRQVVGEFSDALEFSEGRWLIARREARFILNNGA